MPNPQGNIKSHIPYFTKLVEDVPGDFAEFGVFEGGIIELLRNFQGTRAIWAFDTFEGIPTEGYIPELDAGDPPGKWIPRKDIDIPHWLESMPNVRVVKGLFQNTLATAGVGVLALVHMDCDNYVAYKTVLDWLPLHLTNGSVVVFDDYNACPGAKKAVDEFCEQHTKILRQEQVTHLVWGSKDVWAQVKA
jgi:O-methyltransferase